MLSGLSCVIWEEESLLSNYSVALGTSVCMTTIRYICSGVEGFG